MKIAYHTFFDESDFNNSAFQIGPVDPVSQLRIVENLTKLTKHGGQPWTLTEVCCGGAWFAIRAANKLRPKHINFLDTSRNQLHIAKTNAKTQLEYSPTTAFIEGDISEMSSQAIRSNSTIMSFAIHLLSHQQRISLFDEVFATTEKGGYFSILTINNSDIGNSVFDQLIEGYADIDKERFPTIKTLQAIALKCGWGILGHIPIDASITYGGVAEAIKILDSRPFSTFALLEERFGVDETQRRIDNARRTLERKPEGFEVRSRVPVTLINFRKQ